MTAYYALIGWVAANALIFLGAIELYQWSRRRRHQRNEAILQAIWSRMFDIESVPTAADRLVARGYERDDKLGPKGIAAPVSRS